MAPLCFYTSPKLPNLGVIVLGGKKSKLLKLAKGYETSICRIVSSGDLTYNRVIIVDNNVFIVCVKFTSIVYVNFSPQKEKTKTRVTV